MQFTTFRRAHASFPDGATAVMGNFSDTALGTSFGLKATPVEGRMKGVFTGSSGATAGFVTGFSLQGGNGANLDGLGLLTGSAL